MAPHLARIIIIIGRARGFLALDYPLRFFGVAAVALDITWLSVTASIVLLVFGLSGVVHALLTRKGRPENYIYVCGIDALVGLTAVVWGIVGGWWY